MCAVESRGEEHDRAVCEEDAEARHRLWSPRARRDNAGAGLHDTRVVLAADGRRRGVG